MTNCLERAIGLKESWQLSLFKFWEETTRSPCPTNFPLDFTLTIPSSGSMGPKNGINVDQLQSPDINGQMRITRNLEKGVWYIKTQNIHRFHLSANSRIKLPVALAFNDTGDSFEVDPNRCEDTWYLVDASGRWTSSNEARWQNIHQISIWPSTGGDGCDSTFQWDLFDLHVLERC